MNHNVPLPKRMRALAKDHRGYPVPFIVLRDLDGKPHFVANDGERIRRALRENRCAICGSRLERLRWWVGGPLSAFHPDGAYIDTALHHACMTYALQVCPYLAAPGYLGRIDDRLIDKDRLPADKGMLIDHTQIPGRPVLFVAVAAIRATVSWDPVPPVTKPKRPYLAVEYWRHGKQLSGEVGRALIHTAYPDKKQPLTGHEDQGY